MTAKEMSLEVHLRCYTGISSEIFLSGVDAIRVSRVGDKGWLAILQNTHDGRDVFI